MKNHILFVWITYSLLFNISWAMPPSQLDFQPSRGEVELKSIATATWLGFIDVYDAALYAAPEVQARQVLRGNHPFSLELHYKVSISKSQLINSADEVLSRQHTKNQRALYQSDINALHDFYQDVTKGDRFRIDIRHDKGLYLFFNDELLYQNTNISFARYYLGLWLAENSLSESLRKELLNW
jgi:hypothetical protein|tara:strand:+ start:837 stop:1385 length:549 start_codon:yes stop_codon:yes gene_type:complete